MDSKHSAQQNLVQCLLTTLADDILPLTEQAVRQGNKVFGAALLKKSNYSTYLAETNNEMESPLHHGEMHLLKRYFEIDESCRIPANELLFLSTHEPCSMCLSAITWSGFDNFYYFFSHEDSRDSFEIPHDLNILKQVFNLEPGQYQKSNAFWQSHNLISLIDDFFPDSERETLYSQVALIKARYAAASEIYQQGKSSNDIPLR